ncbi:MAG TPA: UDP-N-acetylmuramate dehydrogenase [Acidimicrobiales bacterium]|nr:UDP-N-acetylmuramate dehydrogenase [Acidimicrobiales bacterium]
MAEPAGSVDEAGDRVGAALAVLRDLGERAVRGGALGPLTTYRVGGAASILVTARSLDDLSLAKTALAESGLPVLVVGRGSNLLVSDRGFPGIAIVLDPSTFSDLSVQGTFVRAGAALPLPSLARQSVEAGFAGLEWGVGVPGSVGGAVRMNAGGHGSDVAHHLESATLLDLTGDRGPEDVPVERMEFAYRHSAVTPAAVVVSACFRLSAGDSEDGRRTIREIVRWRREHQPGGQNAGSVFTNPPGTSAGWLVDSAGLKGRRWRTAEVSPKHANFIQADRGGSADDVYELIHLVRAEVLRQHGIELRPEVRLIGFTPSTSSGGSE